MMNTSSNEPPDWASPTVPGLTPELIAAANLALEESQGKAMLSLILDPSSYVLLITLAQTGFCFGKLEHQAAIKARSMLSALCMHAGSCDPVLAEFLSKTFQGLNETALAVADAEARRKQARAAEQQVKRSRPGLWRRVWRAIRDTQG
jgi:hypothetical protein